MIEFNKNYNCDSDIFVKKEIDNNVKFDLILTDPPYNLNKDFGNSSDCLPLDEFLKVTEKRINTYKDLLTDTGSIIWFGIHNYIGFIQVIMYNAKLNYRRMYIWYYENGFSRNVTSPLAQ